MDGYTFENFIVGSSNKFAHAAALGVVKNPGRKAYNPLFIYGSSGLGKTHLLLATGSAIHEKMPEAILIFIAPPSIEILEKRLRDRHTETEENLKLRLSNAKKELELKNKYDYVIVNDKLETASHELRNLITKIIEK